MKRNTTIRALLACLALALALPVGVRAATLTLGR